MASLPDAVSTCTQRGEGTEAKLDDDGNSPGGSNARQVVAAVILLVALVGVGLWLSGTLRGAASIQDCVAAGRTNCAPIR